MAKIRESLGERTEIAELAPATQMRPDWLGDLEEALGHAHPETAEQLTWSLRVADRPERDEQRGLLLHGRVCEGHPDAFER